MYKKTPIGRIIGHAQFRLCNIKEWIRAKRGTNNYFNENSEDNKEMAALAKKHYQEYVDSEPEIEPRRTVLYYGTGKFFECNFLNAFIKRKDIVHTYYWAAEHGFTTYIVDYATPFGLLALQTLNDLRANGEFFNLYVYKGNFRPKRRTYRLIPETQFEIIMEAARSDYCFSLYGAEVLHKILFRAGILCKGHGIEFSKLHTQIVSYFDNL